MSTGVVGYKGITSIIGEHTVLSAHRGVQALEVLPDPCASDSQGPPILAGALAGVEHIADRVVPSQGG